MENPRATPSIGADGPRAPHSLLVSGWIELGPPGSQPVAVRRTMTIFGSDGASLGLVAAVVVDQARQLPTHLLLGRGHPDVEYRLVPLSVIERVDALGVHLQITSQDLARLPRRSTASADYLSPQE